MNAPIDRSDIIRAKRYTPKVKLTPARFSWTAERVAELKTLFSQGFTCDAIAKSFGGGLTRNAVIGKCDRLGLKRDGVRIRPNPKTPATPRSVNNTLLSPIVRKRSEFNGRPSPIAAADVREIKAESAFALPDRDTVEIFDLRSSTCRWPYGAKTPFRFCGLTTADPDDPECSYCASHAKLAYVPRPVKERAAA